MKYRRCATIYLKIINLWHMNQQKLELTRLLGKKELRHIEWCKAYTDKCWKKNSDWVYICMYCSRWGGNDRYEEVSATPTLSDFHKWLVDSDISWRQTTAWIWFENFRTSIPYDSSKDLLDQSPETLAQIIELIRNNQ